MEEEKQPVTTQPPIQAPAPEAAPAPEVPKKSGNPLAILLSIVIVLLLSLSGYLYYQNMQLQKQINETVVIESSPKPEETADPTLIWKSYTNTELGFSIKYPNNWSEIPYNISTTYPLYGLKEFVPENFDKSTLGGTIRISYWENPDNLPLEEIENKYRGEAGGPNLYFPDGNWIKINGLNAYTGYQVGCEPFMCDRATIVVGTTVIQIKSLYTTNNVNGDVFNRMLSTFSIAN